MQKHRQERLLTAVFLLILFGGFVLFFLLPKNSFSADEKRVLQPAPKVSLSTAANGTLSTNVESYLADHFPARKELVGLHAYFDLLCGKNGENGIYMGQDGWLINTPVKPNPVNFRQNLQSMRDFVQETKLSASLMIVPSTGYIMDSELPQLHEDYLDADLLGQAKEQTDGTLQWVELSGQFMDKSEEEQLYYRTDHHWTTAGAYLAYASFAGSNGFSPIGRDAFQVQRSCGFYGTTYSKSGFWNTPADTLEIWKNPALQVQVEIREDGKQSVQKSDSLYFPEQLKNEDQYPVFLNGNHSLVRITNPKAAGSRLLVVKDSYANSLVPFLAAHYRQIDMVDLRYYHKTAVSALVKQDQLDSVLFCYGLDDAVNDSNLSLLA